MIFRKIHIIFFSFLLFIFSITFSDEKYEGLIASVESEAITTYDLSERIKLVLKSLNLEDTIKNRDSVRDRVLELLIIEKLKKIEAQKSQVIANDDEVIQFASVVYNFPPKDFDDFKNFLEGENIDFDIVLEQLRNELLWKKLSQQMFSSKITINTLDIDAIIKSYKNKIGKIEYDFSEIIFINTNSSDWENSKKKMENVISLIEDGTEFDLLAEKFSDVEPQGNNKSAQWILEDNLNKETKKTLQKMEINQIKTGIKISNGYKIIKLNNKRKFGKKDAKLSFLKFSSLDVDNLKELNQMGLNCRNFEKMIFNDDIKYLNIKDVVAKDLSDGFLNQIETTQVNQFTNIFEIAGEYNLLLICEKNEPEIKPISRDLVERRAFSKKFNQLANTFISNIRKSANIKFFNK